LKPKKDTHIIHSLDKGLHLLETIEQANNPVTLKYLWEKLGWDKATIHRLLVTLEKRGYLIRNAKTKEYALGLKIFGLYDSLKRKLDIQQITRPFLREISEETGESTHLVVAVGMNIVFIDRITSAETLSVNTQIGSQEPMYCTALGKIILANLDFADLSDYVPKKMVKYTKNTLTNWVSLKKELKISKDRGYALDNEEYVDGIRCIASAIFNDVGAPIAALGISAPKYRFPDEKVEHYGHFINERADQISKQMGFVEESEQEAVEA